MNTDLKEICEKIVKTSPCEAEAYAVSSRTFSVEVRSQKVQTVYKGHNLGIALRLMKGKKTGFAYSNNADTETLIKNAADNLRSSSAESAFKFAPAQGTAAVDIMFDGTIAKIPEEEKIALAMKIESSAYAHDKRIANTEAASYSDEEYEVHISTSEGFSSGYKKTLCSGSMQAISEEKGQSEEGYCLRQYGSIRELIPEEIGRKAASEAVELLGGRIIRSGALPVVLSPLVSSQFLAAAAPIFSAENVRKGKSLLKGMAGKQAASERFSLVEDALLKNGLASRPFDDEGLPSKRTELIKNGQLKGFLHYLDSAAKDGACSTSSAVRSTFKAPPVIGTTNLYIEQGGSSRDALFAAAEKGIFITRVMALHSLNPVSGDFSLGASGIMIENGKKTFPVRGITIAGNLAEMLLAVKDIGNDLEFFPETGYCGSPSLLIDKLSISGE